MILFFGGGGLLSRLQVPFSNKVMHLCTESIQVFHRKKLVRGGGVYRFWG